VLRNMLIDEGRGLRPEFVNRFDEFVVFHSLSPAEVRQILQLQLKGLRKMLKAQQMELDISDPALDKLAAWSYDPAMGARPVRRSIDQRIINPLAEKMMSAPQTAGRTVTVGVVDDGLSIDIV
jgi:ATP-dependent Clp protease ATP-binding subunit ClpA